VLVRDLTRAEGLQDCLRVTIGSPEENTAFLTAMRAALSARRLSQMMTSGAAADHPATQEEAGK